MDNEGPSTISEDLEVPEGLWPVIRARDALFEAEKRATKARDARDEAIRKALDDGFPVSDIALVSDLRRERIYQIRDGRR
ncbi:hypothetical protein [Cellulomonas sp. Marseille-Q8402]